MPDSRRPRQAQRSGLSLAVTALALVVTLYLVLHIVGALFKLLFLVAVAAIALGAWRAWRVAA
jgi:hypothetical protein